MASRGSRPTRLKLTDDEKKRNANYKILTNSILRISFKNQELATMIDELTDESPLMNTLNNSDSTYVTSWFKDRITLVNDTAKSNLDAEILGRPLLTGRTKIAISTEEYTLKENTKNNLLIIQKNMIDTLKRKKEQILKGLKKKVPIPTKLPKLTHASASSTTINVIPPIPQKIEDEPFLILPASPDGPGAAPSKRPWYKRSILPSISCTSSRSCGITRSVKPISRLNAEETFETQGGRRRHKTRKLRRKRRTQKRGKKARKGQTKRK